MKDELFLIDTNSLITPYLSYYPFDFAKGFWNQLENHIKSGTVVILDLVKAEILKGKDDLTSWLQNIDIAEYIDRRQSSIISCYSAVLQNIGESPHYQETALREWSSAAVADPWLIAAAAVFNYTIITFEKPNGNLNARNPSKKAKIPDIASQFGVKTEDLYYMMRKLHFSL